MQLRDLAQMNPKDTKTWPVSARPINFTSCVKETYVLYSTQNSRKQMLSRLYIMELSLLYFYIITHFYTSLVETSFYWYGHVLLLTALFRFRLDVICYHCSERGHKKWKCPLLQKSGKTRRGKSGKTRRGKRGGRGGRGGHGGGERAWTYIYKNSLYRITLIIYYCKTYNKLCQCWFWLRALSFTRQQRSDRCYCILIMINRLLLI